jgi:hypothetical protein
MSQEGSDVARDIEQSLDNINRTLERTELLLDRIAESLECLCGSLQKVVDMPCTGTVQPPMEPKCALRLGHVGPCASGGKELRCEHYLSPGGDRCVLALNHDGPHIGPSGQWEAKP